MAVNEMVLEARCVAKRFGGVVALKGVDFSVRTGEVLALVGENGAGKSTLMKILSGVQPPDQGEILIDGRRRRLASVADAQAAGIALIHQELNLAENLDAAGNVFLGREPRRLGFLNRARMEREAENWLTAAGLEIDPRTPVAGLSIGKRQQLEIAKALAVDARVLIMDEPTSSLSDGETRRLFEVIRGLKNRGVAVVYISHRLGEVMEIADRVTVLRDGENAGDLPRAEMSEEAMVKMMVGRDLYEFFPGHGASPGGPALAVSGLRTGAYPGEEVSFEIRSGEIVGVAGLVGAGRSEVLRALFGIDAKLAGRVAVGGRGVEISSPRDAIRAGLALVPEDRKAEGLVLEMSVAENLSLAAVWRDRRPGGFRNVSKERAIETRMRESMRIKAAPAQAVGLLSGGNQQKVALGKWLAMEPRVLLLDEPTRGVDVGAKQEIYGLMKDLVAADKAVLFVSSDLMEVLAMSDRVLVMCEGRLVGDLPRDESTEEKVMKLATGAGTR